MTYSIKWRPKALKELRRLPRDVAARIVNLSAGKSPSTLGWDEGREAYIVVGKQ